MMMRASWSNHRRLPLGGYGRAGFVRDTFLLVIVAAGCGLAEGEPPPNGGSRYGTPRQVATLANEEINESSGLAASRLHAGRFWTHNDSGDSPRIFAFDETGQDLGEVHVARAEARDWEDMASATLDGKAHLILADVGDNARRRESCSLYVIDEPTVDGSRTVAAQRIAFRYQDGPRDCEAIAVDAPSRQIFLATKALAQPCAIYQLDWPNPISNDILVARRIAAVSAPMVTGMDISADGRRAVLVTYANAYEFLRGDSETWREAFQRQPAAITMPARRQGEAICYGQDGSSLYLTSERTPTPLWQVVASASPQSSQPTTD